MKRQQAKIAQAVAARKMAARSTQRAAVATHAPIVALNGTLSYAEMGERLGITKMRVCQILAQSGGA